MLPGIARPLDPASVRGLRSMTTASTGDRRATVAGSREGRETRHDDANPERKGKREREGMNQKLLGCVVRVWCMSTSSDPARWISRCMKHHFLQSAS